MVKLREADLSGNRWCGPAAVAILTGRPSGDVARHMRRYTGRRQITTTSVREVSDALRCLGNLYLTEIRNYEDLPKLPSVDGFRAGRPTLAAVLRGRTAIERRQTWLVSAGNHWCVVSGRRYACGLTNGRAVWIGEAPRRRARVRAAYIVDEWPY